MADHLTFTLGSHGYPAFKYVPYGLVQEVRAGRGGAGRGGAGQGRAGRGSTYPLLGVCSTARCAIRSGPALYLPRPSQAFPCILRPRPFPLICVASAIMRLSWAQVVPYLLRRAQENASIMTGAKADAALLEAELRRRAKARWPWLGDSKQAQQGAR